jgi:hypothetical protein
VGSPFVWSAQRRFAVVKIFGACVLTAALGFGIYGAVAAAGTNAHTASRPAYTLKITVVGAQCQIFVRIPAGTVLANGTYVRGESLQYNERQLDVVVSDASAVRIYANGRLQPPGPAGRQESLTVTLGSTPSPMGT